MHEIQNDFFGCYKIEILKFGACSPLTLVLSLFSFLYFFLTVFVFSLCIGRKKNVICVHMIVNNKDLFNLIWFDVFVRMSAVFELTLHVTM